MPRLPALLLIVAILVPLAACGREATGTTSLATGQPTALVQEGAVGEPLPPPPGGAAAAPATSVVQEHPRGVFFDWRPLQDHARRAAGASRPDPGRMVTATVVDASGFGAPMAAMTLEVPEGWTGRGGVDWRRQVECVGNTWSMAWGASSPDGLHELTLLPRLAWQVDSTQVVPMNPCPAAPMASARAYLEQLAAQARPGARVLAWRDRQDISAPMQRNAPQGPARWRVEAGELLIGYRLQGIEMRETLVAAVSFSEISGNIHASAEPGLALRAPEGLLDFELAERIRRSGRLDPDWAQRMLAWSRQHVEAVSQRQAQSIQAWHQRRMAEISLAGMAERHRIRMDTLAEIGRINSQVVADRAAAGDRNHARTLDMIQEVSPWRDPGTGAQVDLSIHYRHAWQLEDGRQFLTNDAAFDPARDLGIAGRALEPVR